MVVAEVGDEPAVAEVVAVAGVELAVVVSENEPLSL